MKKQINSLRVVKLHKCECEGGGGPTPPPGPGNPTLTNPSSTFTANIPLLLEVGETYNITFTANFNRGSIIPAYGTSGFRSGLPNTYYYTGYGLPASVPTNFMSNVNLVAGYTVLDGIQVWTSRVGYDEGEQPKDSESNDFGSPLPAGQTTQQTISIEGVYAWYATVNAITAKTKLPLISRNAPFMEVTVIGEIDTINRQTIWVPGSWTAITGIQMFNTFTQQFEWILGNATNSLTAFTQTHEMIGGVDYIAFSNNQLRYGSRRLRLFWT